MVAVYRLSILALLAAMAAWGQTQFFPLRDVKPGLHGKGRTVFAGSKVEEFDVEILGVLENAGPKQSIILGRLSGGPLAQTGVMQGMSGSPVYVDGRLLGAVAMAFAFSKEPIAGIRPIEEMIAAGGNAGAAPVQRAALGPPTIESLLPLQERVAAEAGRMIEIATPISFGGFAQSTIERFAPQLRTLGLEPRQGVLGGGRRPGNGSSAAALEPGAMISVQLINGDLNVGADGTVTHIDGNKVYAFGHRFLSVGRTEMPFSRAEVLALLPNLSTSFKISAAREAMGVITGDHSTTVAGELGRQAKMVPVSVKVKAAREYSYRFDLVNDRFLTPFLVAMSLHSGLEATERAIGASTVRMTADLKFDGGVPVRSENVWAGDANVTVQAALGAAIPLSYAMQSGFPEFQPAGLDFEFEVVDQKRQYTVEQAWASRRTVAPGEEIEVHAVLAAAGGREVARKLTWKVPAGAQEGPLYITVTDALAANLLEFQPLLGQVPGSASEVTDVLNKLRPNNAAYMRVWRADPSYQVGGRLMADPPASLELILRRTQTSGGAMQPMGSKVAERAFEPVDGMVTGTKTIQVEIKE